MKATFFMSYDCEESMDALKLLENSEYEFEQIDILKDLNQLRRFLAYRDSAKFFEEAKKDNRVGVPTLMFGDGEYFYDAEDGLDLSEVDIYFKK